MFTRETDEERAARFAEIYTQKRPWGGKESKSGVGSSLAATERIRKWLPDVFSRHDVHSLLDIPCGDLNWMHNTAISMTEYVGVDIVPNLIAANKARFPTLKFTIGDLVVDKLPTWFDAVLCRDCFIHLPDCDIMAAIANIRRSNAKHLITSTYDNVKRRDLKSVWRPIDLTHDFFALGDPIEWAHENEYETSGKKIAIWKL